MGLFNNIIDRKTDDSSTVANYDIILSEYARKKDLAKYLYKGRNKTNILHSNIDMGNNKITNLRNPGSAYDAASKRFLHKRIQKLTTDYNLESSSGNINSIKNEIDEIQENMKVTYVHPFFYDYMSKVDQMACKRDRDGSLNGR